MGVVLAVQKEGFKPAYVAPSSRTLLSITAISYSQTLWHVYPLNYVFKGTPNIIVIRHGILLIILIKAMAMLHCSNDLMFTKERTSVYFVIDGP